MIRRLAAAILVAISAPLAAQAPRMVGVGDHRLEVITAGTTGPIVVFEAGLGDDLSDWAKVWPEVATFARVVAYSRAGLGHSERGSSDNGAVHEMRELHTLLDTLHLAPPYILVGRSYGGLLVRLFTSLYPHDVSGLVLVDGTHEAQVKRWGMIDSTYPGAFRHFFDSLLTTLKPGAEQAETRETMRIQALGTVEGLEPLPDIPMAVLTSVKAPDHPQYVNQRPAGFAAWRAMHDEWYAHTTNGLRIVTDKDGHSMQDDDPALVAGAIRFVVDRAH